MTVKVRKAQLTLVFQGVAVQPSAVESQSACDVPHVQLPAGCGKDSCVEERIGGNEILLAFVLRPLPHSCHSCSQFPSSIHRLLVAQVVVHRVQLEVQPILLGALFIFLPAVLLVAQYQFQLVVVAQAQHVVADQLVVIYLLEGQRLRIALHVVLTEQFTCRLITFSLDDAGSEMIV